MTGSSDACVAQRQCCQCQGMPQGWGNMAALYTLKHWDISIQVGFCPLRHGHPHSNSRLPTASPWGLVQYVLIEQPSGSIWNALPLTLQVESIGMEKLKLVFQMWELKQHQSRENRFPSFTAEQGRKSSAFQSLDIICTEAEYLQLIRVKEADFLTGGLPELF